MKKRVTLALAFLVLGGLAGTARAAQVDLQLVMPYSALWPGIPCFLFLALGNQGTLIDSAQVFVALDIGTGDYWFWPSWSHYPPNLDWWDTDIPPGFEERSVLPAFTWPTGCGSGSAQFIAAVLAGGVLVSDVAVTPFTWQEELPGFELLPAGSFTMGSPPGEMCRSSDEVQHTVDLTHGFYIQRTEVTQLQWIAVFGLNPSYFVEMQRPVEQVTWFDCVIYCNRLSMAEGLDPCYYADPGFTTVFDGTPPVTSGTVYWVQSVVGYRLPTESEWEYACRAGTTTAYNSAQNNTSCSEDPRLDPIGWYAYNSDIGTGQGTQTVGHKAANAWGLFDMHGNVLEWCWDWDGTYPVGPATDPSGPGTGSSRTARGGSWVTDAEGCRSAHRSGGGPDGSNSILGFRPVRTGL